MNISTKSFVTAIGIIFVLMILTYGLTFAVADGLPFWKWVLSPVLVLGTEDRGSILMIIAFLLMPLIIPVAQAFDISAQLCVVAFAFGDGFSNVFYPTNPVLLIGLGLANVDYGTWAKWSMKFQLVNLILTSVILLVGRAIGYA